MLRDQHLKILGIEIKHCMLTLPRQVAISHIRQYQRSLITYAYV